jgi:hypothetical protein
MRTSVNGAALARARTTVVSAKTLRRVLLLMSGTIAVAFLASAQAALATTYFVAPTGTGSSPCVQTDPCSFDYAVTHAPSGADVNVEQGAYTVSSKSGLAITADLDIHGPDGGSAAVDFPNAATTALTWNGQNETLRNLNLTCSSCQSLISGSGTTTIDRVRAIDPDASGSAATLVGSAVSITNSLLVGGEAGFATQGFGFSSGSSASFVNDTIIGGSFAIDLHGPGPATAEFDNSIAYLATKPGAHGVHVSGPITFSSDHSDYPPVILDQGASVGSENAHLTAPPIFRADLADLSASDYHPTRQSPTIDAGLSGLASGSFDLDGEPRTIGPQTDIGAYEATPLPTITITQPTQITQTAMRLNATVDDHDFPASASYSYGLSAHYDHAPDAVPLPARSGPQPVSILLTGLTPGTTYHYDLCVLVHLDSPCTSDATATTLPDAPTISATRVQHLTTTSAVITTAVDANNDRTLVRVEYGRTEAYGTTTSAHALLASRASQLVSETLTHLRPGTVYHARIVAQNRGGTVTGADIHFRTPTSAFRIASLKVRHATIKLTLIAPSAGSFSAKATFGSGSRRAVLFGRGRVTAPTAGRVTLTIKPGSAARAALLHQRLHVTVLVRFSPARGTPTTKSRRVTVS